MKSVTVGNAAYTLVMLAGSSVSPLLWIPFWIDTFATIIVSFTQTNHRLSAVHICS